jgi:hypothetical protein
MTRGVPQTALRKTCVDLRVKNRMSLKEIHAETGAAVGSLSVWLSAHPLTEEERRAKIHARVATPRKARQAPSKFLAWADIRNLSRADKAAASEAAVLFRLALNGLCVFGPMFDGSKEDWIVSARGGRFFARIQVKSPNTSWGQIPHFAIRCTEGHGKKRRYTIGEFDFLVGYDLSSDTAYVFSEGELEGNKTSIGARDEAAEAWRKVTEFLDAGVAQR